MGTFGNTVSGAVNGATNFVTKGLIGAGQMASQGLFNGLIKPMATGVWNAFSDSAGLNQGNQSTPSPSTNNTAYTGSLITGQQPISTNQPSQQKGPPATVAKQPVTPVPSSGGSGGGAASIPQPMAGGVPVNMSPANMAAAQSAYNASQGQSGPTSPGTQNPNQPGDQPNPASGSPYINAINTQQSYASGQGNPAVNTSIGGLQGVAANQSPQVQQAESQYNQFAQQSPWQIAAMQNDPNMLANIATGNAANASNAASAEQNALAQNVQNALTGQGQQITAGTNAGQMAQGQVNTQQGSAANVMNSTVPQPASYGQTVFNPATGQYQSPGDANLDPQTTANSLASQVISGKMTYDQAVSSLGYAGSAGQQFLNQALGAQSNNTYNIPGGQATTQAIANTNAQIGSTAQTQAASLSQSLAKVSAVVPQITNLMISAGLNSQGVPWANQQINTFLAQAKPADVAAMNAGIADVKNYVSNILGTSGDLTPTEIGNMMSSFDPGNFTPSQLNSFINDVSAYGQSNLGPTQATMSNAYGANGGNSSGAYGGTPANTSLNTQASNGSNALSGVTNPVTQGIFGAIMNGGSWIGQGAGKMGTAVFGAAAEALMTP